MTVDISDLLGRQPRPLGHALPGGSPLPGLASVSATHGRKLDSKSAPGTNGAHHRQGLSARESRHHAEALDERAARNVVSARPTLTYRREPPRASASAAQTKAAAERARQQAQGEALVAERLYQTSVQLAAAGATEQDIVAKQQAQLAIARATPGRARVALVRSSATTSTSRTPRLTRSKCGASTSKRSRRPTRRGKGVYEVKIKAIESKAPSSSSTRSVGRRRRLRPRARAGRTAFRRSSTFRPRRAREQPHHE